MDLTPRKLMTARYAEAAGGVLYSTAIAWLVWKLTGSPWALSFALILYLAPKAVGGMAIGHLIDAWLSKASLMGVSAARVVVALIPPILFLDLHAVAVWPLYAVTLTEAILGSFTRIGTQTLIRHAVKPTRLLPFNAWVAVGADIAQVVVLLGTTLYIRSHPAYLLLVGTGAFLTLSLAALGTVPRDAYPERWVNTEALTAHQLETGLAEVWKTPRLGGLLVSGFAVNFAVALFAAELPVLVAQHFGTKPAVYTLMLAALGAGSLVASTVLAAVPAVRRLAERRSVAAVLGMEVALAALIGGVGSWTLVALELGAMVAVGLAQSGLNTVELTYLQRATKPRLIGRVMGALLTTGSLGAVSGFLVAGWALTTYGVTTTFWLFSAVGAAGAAAAALWIGLSQARAARPAAAGRV
jgi:hypothetical protein